MTCIEKARDIMIAKHLKDRGVNDPAVLSAMAEVPREAFLPETMAEFAYDDSPLPIGQGQTISQPYIVAIMTQLLEIEPGDRVLEIGTGSGYATTILTGYTKCRPASLPMRAAVSRVARGVGGVLSNR